MADIPNHIPSQVELHFADYYHHFKEFQISPAYRPYWDKCMEAVQDRELLSHIIFCNDLFHIPRSRPFCSTMSRTSYPSPDGRMPP